MTENEKAAEIAAEVSAEKSTVGAILSAEKGEFWGYASTYGNADAAGDVMDPGAYEDAVKAAPPPVFYNHRTWWDVPMGKITEWKSDDKGLFVRGLLNLELQQARDVYSAIKFGSVSGFSVGIVYRTADAGKAPDGFNHIKKIANVREISICTFPANKAAGIDAIKAGEILTVRDYEQALRDAGLSRAAAVAMTAAAKRINERGDPDLDFSAVLNRINAILGRF